jgi:hypothetical protein
VNSTIYVGNIKMEKLYRYNREVSTLNRQCLDNILMRVRVMVLNATFNNVSVISWQSNLLVKETGVHRETADLPQVTDKLYHKMLYEYTSP